MLLKYWGIGWIVLAITAIVVVPLNIYKENPIDFTEFKSVSLWRQLSVIILIFALLSIVVFVWPLFLVGDICLLMIYLLTWGINKDSEKQDKNT